MGATCIVCGCREEEVSKMHYFPANVERSTIWKEKLGIKYAGSLQNHRICSKHFTRDSYVDLISYKLRRDAIPIALEDIPSTSQVRPHVVESNLDSGLRQLIGEEHVTETCKKTAYTPTQTPRSLASARGKLFRDITNLRRTDVTPRKQKLINIIYKKEDHLRKVKSLCKKRLHSMKTVSNFSDSNVIRNLFKDMPSVTADFMISQIRNANVKGAKGRRWTLDDKVLALCIFKRGPRCYNLLRKFVALPHKRTLLALLGKVKFQAGINPHIFNHLNEKLPDGIDRCCALLLDEIDIQEHVEYDTAQDKILGFEDFGQPISSNNERKPTNKALVFMLVGLSLNWKQPVAFYFCNNGCNSSTLKKCIFEVLNASKMYAQVDIVTTICDMGVNNVKCLKELGVTVESPYFFFEDKKIYAMFDPPHLLKCTYSLFRKHNILIPVVVGNELESIMEARFGDILQAYEIDKKNPLIFRTMHKIKASHLNPVMRYAMKVCVAAQIFSHTVGAFLYSLISTGVVEPRVVATATFIKEMDTLFDSFNGRTNKAPDGKELRCAVNENTQHLTYWEESFKKVNKWTFKRLNKAGIVKSSKPPSQIGWLTSLNAIRGVWEYMKDKGASSLRPRSLNQDPLENLFGAIRYGCGCNDNPNTKQFIGSLKTQILNGLTNKAIAANCEEDDNILLSNLKSFLNIEKEDESEEPMPTEFESVTDDNQIIEDLSSKISADVSAGNPNVFSVAYVAGFILKGIRKQIDCELCSSQLVCSNSDLHNIYIYNKEWSDTKNVLIYPSQEFTVVVGNGITTLESFLEKNAGHMNVLLNAQIYLKNINFEWINCDKHKNLISLLTIKSICKIGISWWCKRFNQTIKEEKKEKRANQRKIKKFKH